MDIIASDEEILGAKAYNELHVPALFAQWAPQMMAAAQINASDKVLDVACGTGVLAREVASQAGDSRFVSALDAAAGMLAVAQQLEPAIQWQQGVAEELPYDDQSFDVVVCQFGLMFFDNRQAAIKQMLRVLKPRGRLAVSVWASLERSPAYGLAVNMLERMAGPAAANALAAPFVLGDKQELHSLFKAAGAESVEIKTSTGQAQFPSLRSMVEADLRGWLPVMGVNLDEPLIQSILVEAEDVLGHYVTEGGSMYFDAPAHIITAKK